MASRSRLDTAWACRSRWNLTARPVVHGFMGTVNEAAYDRVAATYHRTFDEEGAGVQDPALEDLIGDVRGRRVLSLACGQGRDARLLAALGADVIGVDIADGMLEYARRVELRERRGITFVQGDAQDLAGFEDGGFDGVVCRMALMDIPDLGSVVASVRRVLKPGGFFVASVVHPCFQPHVGAVEDYLVDGRYIKENPPDGLPAHAYHRSLASYVNTLVGAGLMITRIVEPDDEHRPEGGVPNLLYLRCDTRSAVDIDR